MQLIIVTGMSGSGKSKVIDVLEDIGYYCIDNMPPQLLMKFADIMVGAQTELTKVAIVTDVRSGEMFEKLFESLGELRENNLNYKLLFIDAKDDVLIRRYKETRRKHPLLEEDTGSVEEAIRNERRLLEAARQHADYVIDTSALSLSQLRKKILDMFLVDADSTMLISLMSFGFKYGIPAEADLVFDVRCLPNPFYIESLKGKTGKDSEVRDYVFSFEEATELLKKLIDLIDFLIPLYIKEGKSQLVIATGCTGGKHRSVAFTEALHKHLKNEKIKSTVNHRDIEKG